MGQAAEMAKKNLGLDKRGNQGDGSGLKTAETMSQLEAAIDLVSDVDAKELLQAKARELKANMELRASEAEERAHAGRGGKPSGNGSDQAEKDKLKTELSASAITLLEKGVDPFIVGQYIVGRSSSGIPINLGGGTTNQGFTMSDILTLVDKFRGPAGPSAEVVALQKTIDDMKQEIRSLKPTGSTTPLDPLAATTNSLKSVNELVDNLVKAGLVVKPPAPGTNTGESIEVIRENNRHTEKMAEVKEAETYHKGLVETLQDTAVRIGEGLASRAEDAAEEEEPAVASKKGPQRDTFHCPDCNIEIPIFTDTPDQVTCTKCGQIYKRTTKTVEVKG